MQPEIKCFIGCDVPFEEADTVIFGAPFDSTTSFQEHASAPLQCAPKASG